MNQKQVKPVKLSNAAIVFACIAALSLIAGLMAPFFTVLGLISAVMAIITGGLWWINYANGRKGL